MIKEIRKSRWMALALTAAMVVTASGVENLTRALPRDPDEIEAWMAKLS